MIKNISQTGGHLGSNLGIVELTVALHYVFNSPHDKIIWDVGHQSYVHKILTGRKGRFGELRKFRGLSGFTKTTESVHDPFGAGHSSTALSAAIGIARVNMLDMKSNYAIAVVGDGSFTGGLVYEALNNSKECKKLIVILNDNGMSISKNVGTIADYLANIRTAKKYYDMRHTTKRILQSVPLIGKLLVGGFRRITRVLRRSLYNATFFEEVGFDFLGPVDGHHIDKLISVLTEAKRRDNPVFIHVKTQKGRGYEKAELSSAEYHSVGKFDIETGIPDLNNKPGGLGKLIEKNTADTTDLLSSLSSFGSIGSIDSFSENFGMKIYETAIKNKKICAITAAMTEGTELRQFRRDFPERFFDVGIAEEHAAVFAAGLAVSGYIPVFAVYSSFLQRAYDNILHDIALQNLHVVCCVDRAGIVGEDGATHHGIFDVAFLNHIPNVTIFSPSSYDEFNKSFDFAVNEMNSPVFIRYPKGGEDEEFNKKLENLAGSELVSARYEDKHKVCPYNNLNYIYIKNNNPEFLIITYGRISKTAFDVYLKLNENNKPADFLKLNKIKPVNYILHEVMNSCAENVIFIEEGIECGGVSEHITSNMINMIKSGSDKYNKRVKIFAVNDFIEQGTVGQLFEVCGFNPEKIYNNITEI